MLAASGGESDGYLGWWGCPEADATQACAAKGRWRSRYFTAKRPTVWWLSVGRGPRRLEGHGRVPIIVYNNSVYILKLEQKTVVPDQIKSRENSSGALRPGLSPDDLSRGREVGEGLQSFQPQTFRRAKSKERPAQRRCCSALYYTPHVLDYRPSWAVTPPASRPSSRDPTSSATSSASLSPAARFEVVPRSRRSATQRCRHSLEALTR
jgi:hypothetical protein